MKHKKNTNPHKSWAECIWSLTSFLPSLQLMFIFGLLLSAEAQAIGRDRPHIKGRPHSSSSFDPLHPHDKPKHITPYDELLHLCENYTPAKFPHVQQLLIFENSAKTHLMQFDSKQNPLTIAQKTENTDLAKLVLDTTGTLYCSPEQQTNITKEPTKTSKGEVIITPKEFSIKRLTITLLMLEAGCKLVPGFKGDYHKYINGLSLIGIITSVATNNYTPIGSTTPLSAVFTMFLDQLDENDVMDRKLIIEVTQIALHFYSENNDARVLDLLFIRYSEFLTHYDPQNPSGIFFQLINIALGKNLKTTNFLLRFITTREQLNAYIKLANEDNNKKLLTLLHRIKALVDNNVDENNPDALDSAAVKTVVYLRKRHEHITASGNLLKLKQALLIFDEIFGKYPGCQKYVGIERVVAGQLKEAAAATMKLLKKSTLKRDKAENQVFLNFIAWISQPHPITIEEFQPPSFDVTPPEGLVYDSEANVVLPNSLNLSSSARQVSVLLAVVSIKHQKYLLEELQSIQHSKTPADRKQKSHALMEKVKLIDNHVLYFCDATIGAILVESMHHVETIKEKFYYFKMAIWLRPAAKESQFFSEQLMIFAPYYPDEIYSYIKKKLLECERYTPTQLHDLLVLAKQVIKAYYDRLLPPSVFSETQSLDHLNALFIILTAPDSYLKLGEEVILGGEVIVDEIKALQQHKLLGQEFKLGNQTFTLKTLKFEFSKHRPYRPNLLSIFFSLLAGVPLLLYGLYIIVKTRRAIPPPPPANPAVIAESILRIAEIAPEHRYIGTLGPVQFHRDGAGEHSLCVILPSVLSKNLFSRYSNEVYTPTDEVLTKDKIEAAINVASQNKKHTVIATVVPQESSFILQLKIDNREEFFNRHYQMFMGLFQTHLIENSAQAAKFKLANNRTDCIKKITELHQKSVIYQKNIETHTSDQRIKDYETLKKKIVDELDAPDLSRSARRTALRTILASVEKIIVLAKKSKTEPCKELPDFSGLSFSDCETLLSSQSNTERTLFKVSDNLNRQHGELARDVEELKQLFKKDSKKFEFEWEKGSSLKIAVAAPATVVATTTVPENPLLLLLTNNEDDDGDNPEMSPPSSNVPPSRTNNDDDDNDKEPESDSKDETEATTSSQHNEPTAEELLDKLISPEDRRLQLVLAPSHWGTQTRSSKVKNQSSSSSSSTSNDISQTPIPEQHQELVQNAEQLCDEIAAAVQPLENENVNNATKNKCIHQLVDLSARFYLALIRLANVRLIPWQGLMIREVSSIRHALRHNATLFIHSSDVNLNRAIYNFGRDLKNLLHATLSQDYTQLKSTMLGILVHNQTESKLSTIQLAIALKVELEFLDEQLSKPDVSVASLEMQQPGFCSGFLTYIGSFMHESHNRKQATALMTNTNNKPFAKIQDGTASELSSAEFNKLSTGNLFYLCWELRNIRGHELNIIETPNQRFINNLMRLVVSRYNELNTQLDELIQTLSVSDSPEMSH